jgi:hypothetical protein
MTPREHLLAASVAASAAPGRSSGISQYIRTALEENRAEIMATEAAQQLPNEGRLAELGSFSTRLARQQQPQQQQQQGDPSASTSFAQMVRRQHQQDAESSDGSD